MALDVGLAGVWTSRPWACSPDADLLRRASFRRNPQPNKTCVAWRIPCGTTEAATSAAHRLALLRSLTYGTWTAPEEALVRGLPRQATAFFTNARSFFSTVESHLSRENDVGHIDPSSREAASLKPTVL